MLHFAWLALLFNGNLKVAVCNIKQYILLTVLYESIQKIMLVFCQEP